MKNPINFGQVTGITPFQHGIGSKALCVEPVARQRDMQARLDCRDIAQFL